MASYLNDTERAELEALMARTWNSLKGPERKRRQQLRTLWEEERKANDNAAADDGEFTVAEARELGGLIDRESTLHGADRTRRNKLARKLDTVVAGILSETKLKPGARFTHRNVFDRMGSETHTECIVVSVDGGQVGWTFATTGTVRTPVSELKPRAVVPLADLPVHAFVG